MISESSSNTRVDLQTSVTSTQMSASALEQENKELIQKLARTQEERSILEEKVRHLESSNSTMASDLIQYYSNDKRGSVSSNYFLLLPKDRRSLELVSDMPARYATPPSRRRQNSSIDRQNNAPSLNLRSMFENLGGNKNQSNHDDTIKNLQRLLEETLTKNMHLQKDLEAMSIQLQKQTSNHS